MKKVLETVAVYSFVFFMYVCQFVGFIFYGIAILMIPVAIADHFFLIEFKLLVKSVCTLAVFLAVILFYANWKFEKGQEKGFPEKFRDFILYFNFVALIILIVIKFVI